MEYKYCLFSIQCYKREIFIFEQIHFNIEAANFLVDFVNWIDLFNSAGYSKWFRSYQTDKILIIKDNGITNVCSEENK